MGEDPDLVTVEVVGVRQHLSADEIVVLLLDADAELLVPILIGPTEASAIASAQAGIVPPRPMTHDLLRNVIVATGDGLDHVEITRLDDGVFYADLVLSRARRVDSRASDAIALALRFGVPVLCSAEVVAVAGIEVRTSTSEEDLERFREFLDQVTPEDFETGAEPEEQ
jgi:uncharacterized protein